MSRPNKAGLDFYTRAVGFRGSDSVRRLKSEFGIKGVYIYEEVLDAIYRGNGYYIDWDEDACSSMSEGVGGGCSVNLIGEVIQGCLKWSLFDQRLFNVFNILTSSDIQSHYFEAVKHRTGVDVNDSYLLVNVDAD